MIVGLPCFVLALLFMAFIIGRDLDAYHRGELIAERDIAQREVDLMKQINAELRRRCVAN